MTNKFIHLGDLHLGIRFHKKSLIYDQRFVLEQIVKTMKEEQANLVVAGDVFDTVSPSIEAQQLWFWFLEQAALCNQEDGTETFVIPGNHDSSSRLSLANPFLTAFNLHVVSPDKPFETFKSDNCRILCVPFSKPESVNYAFGTDCKDYDSAYATLLSEAKKELGTFEDVILIAHQSFEGCKRGESEFKPFMPDSISVDTVSEFNQVWAGHIHGFQQIGNITYCGSLLQYAFGDDYHPNYCFWTIEDKKCNLKRLSLEIPHPLKQVTGDLESCLAVDDNGEYFKFIVKNCDDYDDALSRLQDKFENVLSLVRDEETKWEADLTKPIGNFQNFQEALDAFCDHLEIPRFTGKHADLIQEALDAYKESET